MSKITLKTATRKTSKTYSEIEDAVRNAYVHFGFIRQNGYRPTKKAAKKAAKKK